MSQNAPMRCADVEPYLSPFVDGELATSLREAVATHLATCPACTRKVERYRETQRLLGSLTQTAPSPDVFDRIMAAIPERYPEPTARESLGGEVRDFSLRRKLSALEHPALDDARVISIANRRTWAMRLLPVVAALLLVALGLATFGRFSFLPSHSVASTSTPVIGQAAEQTQVQVAHLQAQLGFDPKLPQYYPLDATFLNASVGTTGFSPYLDVVWGFAQGYKIHARESLGADVWPGYATVVADPTLSWQLIGYQPWRPLVLTGAIHTTAIGQNRGNISIAMDVDVDPSSDQYEAATRVLRELSLSIDLPYRPIAVSSMALPQLQQRVLHYTLVGRDASNHLLWRADGYVDQASNKQRIEVTNAKGALLYTDIIDGNNVLRLDATRQTYQRTQLSALHLDTWATNNQAAFQNPFRTANSYVDNVELWNVGTIKYQGQFVNDLERVDAPAPTHYYVATVPSGSLQVVAVVVDAQTSMQPGGPYAPNPFDPPFDCASYTLLTYVTSSQVPATGFSDQVPSGYSSGNVQQTVSC